jgi:hypothetical protein
VAGPRLWFLPIKMKVVKTKVAAVAVVAAAVAAAAAAAARTPTRRTQRDQGLRICTITDGFFRLTFFRPDNRRTSPNMRFTMMALRGQIDWGSAYYLSKLDSIASLWSLAPCPANASATAQGPAQPKECSPVGSFGGGDRRSRTKVARASASGSQTRTRWPSQQCMEPLKPDQMIVGNSVKVKYDNGVWYDGKISSIAQKAKGKVLNIDFGDGDKLSVATWKKKETEDFRHDVERDDARTKRRCVVYRLLCTCGEAQWSRPGTVAECKLPDELEILKKKILTNASVDLNRLEAFLVQEAAARQFSGDSSEWTQHVLTHIHSCGTKRSRALLGKAAPGAGAQEREATRKPTATGMMRKASTMTMRCQFMVQKAPQGLVEKKGTPAKFLFWTGIAHAQN